MTMTPTTELISRVTTELCNTTDTPWWVYDDIYIHPHWRQYDIPSIPDLHFYLAGIYIGIIGILGVIGNAMVIYIFSVTRNLRTPPNMFVISLALSDLIFSAVNGFPLFTLSTFQRRWNFGMKTCEIYGLFGGIFGLLSINLMALIATDRYFVIAQPYEALKRLSKKRAFAMIVFVTVWSALWASLPLLGFGAYIPEGFQANCTFDYLTRSKKNIIFNIGLYVCGFAIPMLIIIFSYVKIVGAVRDNEKEMARIAASMGAKDTRAAKDRKTDIKTAKISAVLVSLYLLSWGPYATIALVSLLGHTSFLTPYVAQIPVLFAKTSAVYNPFVYAISHPRYKTALLKEFPCLSCMITAPKSTISRASSHGVSMSRADSQMSDVTETECEQNPAVKNSISTTTIATAMSKSESAEMKEISTNVQANPAGNEGQAEIHM